VQRCLPFLSALLTRHLRTERPHKGSDMNFGAKCTHKTELNYIKKKYNQLRAGSFSFSRSTFFRVPRTRTRVDTCKGEWKVILFTELLVLSLWSLLPTSSIFQNPCAIGHKTPLTKAPWQFMGKFQCCAGSTQRYRVWWPVSYPVSTTC